MNTSQSQKIAGLVFVLLVGFTSSTYAAATSTILFPVVPDITVSGSVAERTPQFKKLTTMNELLTFVNESIDKRLATLGKLKSNIDASQISDTQQQAIISQITTVTNSLTSLRAELARDKTADALKTDVKSIFTGYRVYGVLVPKISMLFALNRELDIATKLSAYGSYMGGRIAKIKESGRDVSARETALASAQDILKTTSEQIVDLMAQVNAVKIADYPKKTKTEFVDLRNKILTVKENLKKAREDLVKASK